MQKLTIDLAKYKKPPEKKPPKYRWQEMMLRAFDQFKISKQFQGIAWGRLRNVSDKAAFIQKALDTIEELGPKEPGRYFIKLLTLLKK